MTHGQHLFEYAVIRVAPRVEREEFLNVGVIVYCHALKFLEVSFEINEKRLAAISDSLDIAELQNTLNAFQQIGMGGTVGGPIGKLPVPERFRWLTAARSTIVQTSAVHLGLCIDPHETLMKLHEKLVR
ncbi:MAG TPA: DUF3037 domain-containing protein [Cyclobacteriaceae bacterium]|nr:DUF3037 domain-containing protein [Cyclobacteriaceae bacterium]